MPMLDYPDVNSGHATKEETETLMAYYGDCVDLGKLPPPSQPLLNTRWAIIDDQTFKGNPTRNFTVREHEDPRSATVEEGTKVFAQTIEQLKETLLSSTFAIF
jgi:hypothetical protein